MPADGSRTLSVSSEVWTSGSPLLVPAGAHCIRIFDNNFRRELEGISFVQPSS